MCGDWSSQEAQSRDMVGTLGWDADFPGTEGHRCDNRASVQRRSRFYNWKNATVMSLRKGNHLTMFCKGVWFQVSWIWDASGTLRSRLSPGRHMHSQSLQIWLELGVCMQASPCAHYHVKTKKAGREGRETQELDFLHFSSRKKKGEKIVLCSKQRWVYRKHCLKPPQILLDVKESEFSKLREQTSFHKYLKYADGPGNWIVKDETVVEK